MRIIVTILLAVVFLGSTNADEAKKNDEPRSKRNLQYTISHHPYPQQAQRRISYQPYHLQAGPMKFYGPYRKDSANDLAAKPEDLQTEHAHHYSRWNYAPKPKIIERPVYIKEPEPIIEIIIKESNVTLPPLPEISTPPPKKKKEEVQVFYVKYKKNPNGYGKDSVIYDPPIPAISPTVGQPEEETEVEQEPQYYPTETVTQHPLPSTTLRTIIKPDSEVYHSPSGVKVTFGKEGFDYDKRSSKLEDFNNIPQAPSPNDIKFPGPIQNHQPRQLSFPPNTFDNRKPLAPVPNFRPQFPRQAQNYRPFGNPYKTPPAAQFSRPLPGPPEYSTLPKSLYEQQQTLPQTQSFPNPIRYNQFNPSNPHYSTLPHFNQPRQPVPYQPFDAFRKQNLPRPQENNFGPQFSQNSFNQPAFPTHEPQKQFISPQLPIKDSIKPFKQPQFISDSNQHFRPPFNPLNEPPKSFNQGDRNSLQPNPIPEYKTIQDSAQPTPNIPSFNNGPLQNNQNIPNQQHNSQNLLNLQQPPLHHQTQQFQNQFANQQQDVSNQQKHFQQNHNFVNQQNDFHSNQNFANQQNDFNLNQNFGNQQNNFQQQQQQFHLNNLQQIQGGIPAGGQLIQAVPKFETHISSIEPSPPIQESKVNLQYTNKQGNVVNSIKNRYSKNPGQQYYQQNQQESKTSSHTLNNIPPEEQYKQANLFQESIRQSTHQSQFLQQNIQNDFRHNAHQGTVSTKTPNSISATSPKYSTSSTTLRPSEPSTTTKDPKILNEQLPDEVPEDLRQQLLSSGILNNADISVLDYDKVGDIPLSALPPDQLANFFGAGGAQQLAASEPIPQYATKDGDRIHKSFNEEEVEDQQTDGSEIKEITKKSDVEMKVVHYNPSTQQGQQVQNSYVEKDATRVDPVAINDNKYNRYLPLKVSGAQFPIPDVPELKGKKIKSVVVLAPVNFDYSRGQKNKRETKVTAKDLAFIKGEELRHLLKNPSLENYRKFLESEKKIDTDKQSVILLVTGSENPEDQEIFMYDVESRTVNKLDGDLSAAFVKAAEQNNFQGEKQK